MWSACPAWLAASWGLYPLTADRTPPPPPHDKQNHFQTLPKSPPFENQCPKWFLRTSNLFRLVQPRHQTFGPGFPSLRQTPPRVSYHLLFDNHIQHWDIALSLWVSPVICVLVFHSRDGQRWKSYRKDPAHPTAGSKGKADFWNGPGVLQI